MILFLKALVTIIFLLVFGNIIRLSLHLMNMPADLLFSLGVVIIFTAACGLHYSIKNIWNL